MALSSFRRRYKLVLSERVRHLAARNSKPGGAKFKIWQRQIQNIAAPTKTGDGVHSDGQKV
jgi:hypothetical protein